jgi:2-C-methyl-D-erythritol 2,4-cyclodiphosphate synthase
MKVGIGYDVHPFAQGRPLILGGVEIEHDRGLQGHSDGDVLLHAVTDALLGAAGLGDIGQHFPSDDQSYSGADSADLLKHVMGLLQNFGLLVENIDTTLVAESPKLSPYMARMRQRIALLVSTPETSVSVKATTHEGMGALGRGEGIAAFAIVLLK